MDCHAGGCRRRDKGVGRRRIGHQIGNIGKACHPRCALAPEFGRIRQHDNPARTFDQGAFEMNIQTRANQIQLSGLGTVLYKKIKHPITNKRIVVNVVAWSPESNMLARGLTALSKDQETKMDATDGGTVFENYQESTDDKSVGTITTIGLEGVSSDPDDF